MVTTRTLLSGGWGGGVAPVPGYVALPWPDGGDTPTARRWVGRLGRHLTLDRHLWAMPFGGRELTPAAAAGRVLLLVRGQVWSAPPWFRPTGPYSTFRYFAYPHPRWP